MPPQQGSLPSYVCVMCRCTCRCVCTCTYVIIHVEARGWSWVSFIVLHSPWLRFLIGLELDKQARLVGQHVPRIYLPRCLLSPGIARKHHCAWSFLCGFWGFKSSSCTFKVSSLLTEPWHQHKQRKISRKSAAKYLSMVSRVIHNFSSLALKVLRAWTTEMAFSVQMNTGLQCYKRIALGPAVVVGVNLQIWVWDTWNIVSQVDDSMWMDFSALTVGMPYFVAWMTILFVLAS